MAKHKKHADHEEHVDESWLIPYADLLTLLLALFIVLFATSSSDSAKLEAMEAAFQKSFGIFDPGSNTPLPGIGEGILPEEIAQQLEEQAKSESSNDGLTDQEKYDLQMMQEIQGTLEGFFTQEGLGGDISMQIDNRGLVISLHDKLLFDSGSATLRPEHINTLIHVAETIVTLDNYVRIEGHTDNVPVSQRSAFSSNWALSSARATNVVELFVNQTQIDPERITAVGCSQYKPVGDNNTAEGRAENRRVDIILLNSKFDALENRNEELIPLN